MGFDPSILDASPSHKVSYLILKMVTIRTILLAVDKDRTC